MIIYRNVENEYGRVVTKAFRTNLQRKPYWQMNAEERRIEEEQIEARSKELAQMREEREATYQAYLKSLEKK